MFTSTPELDGFVQQVLKSQQDLFPSDRRSHRRLPFVYPLLLKVAGQEDWLEGISVNISGAGICLISKLLKNQEQNERRFAELVLKRANLTQITQKRELEEVEAEIANLSIILKESTKKLCKLFKENPDLERDSLKVSRERRMLIIKLEELM